MLKYTLILGFKMLQLDEERKQELIMAKQIRRDTVVINGGTGSTTTRVSKGTL